MSKTKLIAVYALLGPLIGAAVVVLGSLVTESDLRDDTNNTLLFIATAAMFSYPLGILPATFAGITHALVGHRLRPWAATTVICSCGVLGTFLVAWLIGNPSAIAQTPLSLVAFVFPPVISAAILSVAMRARKNAT